MTRFLKWIPWFVMVVLGVVPLSAQDLGKEIRENWGDPKKALGQLEIEIEVLLRIESELTHEYEKLFAQIAEDQIRSVKAVTEPEAFGTLLQSCLIELQKVRWEEATEKLVQEELSKADATPKSRAAEIKEQELEIRLGESAAKLESAEEQLAAQQRLFENGSSPAKDLALAKEAVVLMRADLAAKKAQFALHKEVTSAELEQPLLESTRRLAQWVSRRQLLEKELSQLREEYQQISEGKLQQWRVLMSQKRAELIQAQLVPIQTRKQQVIALISSYKALLEKAEKK